jgi:hypothetical protein
MSVGLIAICYVASDAPHLVTLANLPCVASLSTILLLPSLPQAGGCRRPQIFRPTYTVSPVAYDRSLNPSYIAIP